MNARIARLALALAVSVSLAQCNEIAYPAKFTVKVMDEEGNPVPDTEVSARTFLRWQAGEGFGKDIADYQSEQTDETGHAVFEHPSKRGTFSIDVKQSELFYRTKTIHHKFEEVRGLRWKPENPTIPYVLKKKRNPIALHVKDFGYSSRRSYPKFGEECGYDLERGDWVQPHGKGQQVDFFLRIDLNKQDDDNFETKITVTFPNEEDGLIYYEDEPREGSEFVSDYKAPLEGYQKQKVLKRYSVDGVITSEINREKGNYYFRVRTKLDENGNVENAHYAKLYGDIPYFTYYYNPTPNDRNLEFDPERNLFPNERVISP